MQSRFGFLDDKFPKLAALGRKAENTLAHDNNICLLSLGRIAETITALLCSHNKLEFHNTTKYIAGKLLELGFIDDDIFTKIEALSDTKDDAAANDYSSEMAASRLITTAQELCEWFISSQSQGRFSFLADLFPQADSVPPLAALADFGQEAEDNLHSNTRYCLICLGDIGEFIVDGLMNMHNISMHDRDQIYRINILSGKGIINNSQTDTLHQLRIARNKAVHQRYASEDDGKRLLDLALPLCEWVFSTFMSESDIVRGCITAIDETGLSVNIGRLMGHVDRKELPINEDTDIRECCKQGERKNFRVISKDGDLLALSILQVHNDPWNAAMRHYERYETGQDVKAIIKRITAAFGAFAELHGGLEARLPASEYSITTKRRTPRIGQHITARIKWLNPSQYPYMLLSIRDIETENGAIPAVPPYDDEEEMIPEDESVKTTKGGKKGDKKKEKERNKQFLELCKTASSEEILSAINDGADISVRNSNKMNGLMVAAMYSTHPEVISTLIDAGININDHNGNGNTALIFAAMMNIPEIVRALLEKGADTEIINKARKKALHYARNNPKVNKDAELMKMLGDEGVSVLTETVTPEPEAQDAETLTQEQDEESRRVVLVSSQRDIIKICRSGTPEDLSHALNAGVNVNVINKNGATPLMFAAQSNTAEIVDMLIKAGAKIDIQDKAGNTALIYAVSYNTDDVVNTLLDAGADKDIVNASGRKAADYAGGNYRLIDTEVLSKL